jgi:ERCC4-related helicase
MSNSGKGGVGISECNQSKLLQGFRKGSVNALFSTSVAEEGLDLQNCSIVICYDVPKRPLSVVQTIGRARAIDSEVYFMQPVQPWDNSKPAVRCLLPHGRFSFWCYS